MELSVDFKTSDAKGPHEHAAGNGSTDNPNVKLLIPCDGMLINQSSDIVVPALNEQLTIRDFVNWSNT